MRESTFPLSHYGIIFARDLGTVSVLTRARCIFGPLSAIRGCCVSLSVATRKHFVIKLLSAFSTLKWSNLQTISRSGYTSELADSGDSGC